MHDVKPRAGLVGKRRSSLRDGKKETELGPGNSFSCIRKDFNRETVEREGGRTRERLLCIAESVRAASFSFTAAFAPDLQIAGFSRNECRTLYELLWLKASPEVTRKGLEVLGGGAGALVPEPGMGEPMDKVLVWALVHGDLTIGAF